MSSFTEFTYNQLFLIYSKSIINITALPSTAYFHAIDGQPAWLDNKNPDWTGNFKVKYCHSTWQNVIYGNDDSYLKKILNAKFAGVYLDIIEAYEYYE